ncbi:MAG: serine/threonine protein kinase [Bacillariaceae sp.]|jgi:serine/threonine protein kinase
MEYIEYGTLITFLENSDYTTTKTGLSDTFSDRLDMFLGAADGLLHLHKNGMIHCDMKPANVLVDASSGVPIAKICDFGGSYKLPDGIEEACPSNRGGTHGYISPEQISGKFGPSTDIYALGIILIETNSEKYFAQSRSDGAANVPYYYKY